ncbi:MAG: GNAT family N-acetyltransferase [Bacteroidota bacterium]
MVIYRLAKEEDYQKINDFYNRIYSRNRTMEEFYWEFHNGPSGKSIYVIAEDEGKVVGTNCVIPFKIYNSDIQIITGKSEDTLVDPDYRGQNIFNSIYEFLFSECQKQNITIIWGFTSAVKVFKKLGFEVPFHHQQTLWVNNIGKSYRFLSALNRKNTFKEKVKIFMLCFLSKLKTFPVLLSKVSLKGIHMTHEVDSHKIDQLISQNLQSHPPLYTIQQDKEFQKWRIHQNPYYKTKINYSFYKNDRLISFLSINTTPQNIAYICQYCFDLSVEKSEIKQTLNYVSKDLLKKDICMIRNWNFDHNALNREDNSMFKKAGFFHLNKGIGFVWKDLDSERKMESKDFYLTRVSTQGTI